MTRDKIGRKKENLVACRIVLKTQPALLVHPQYIRREALSNLKTPCQKTGQQPTLGAEAKVECPRHLAKRPRSKFDRPVPQKQESKKETQNRMPVAAAVDAIYAQRPP